MRNSLKNEEDMNEVPEIIDKNLAMTLNLRTLELMKYARIATARRYLCQQWLLPLLKDDQESQIDDDR